MPTTIDLDAHLEAFVTRQVSAGRFNSASEVIRATLRLLENQEHLQALKLQELRSTIVAGASRGPGRDASKVFDRLGKKYKDIAAAQKGRK